MDQKRTIVVALGGNALQKRGEASSEQQQRVADYATERNGTGIWVIKTC